MESPEVIDPRAHLLAALAQATGSKMDWLTHYDAVKEELLRLWNPAHPRILFQGPSHPAWSFGITDAFRKSVMDIDRKLRGRVLEAVMKICEAPMTLQGDTVKPLTGTLSGFWRCRIGEYRLVYKPDTNLKQVLLFEFSSRGSAYD